MKALRRSVGNQNSKRRARQISHSAVSPTTNLPKVGLIPIGEIRANPENARKHSRMQVRAIAHSIEAFGFNAPILIDGRKTIVAGHGRYEAAQLLELLTVPVVYLDHLSDAQAKAYTLADNKLTDRSSWDDAKVAVQLKELSELSLDFEIEAIGFEPPEIDFRIQSLESADETDRADEFRLAPGPAVTVPGDVWRLGPHRVLCGNALEAVSYAAVLGDQLATAVFTDPPYNVKIDGHVSGKGRAVHREFAMASGEMNEAEFTNFLTTALSLLRQATAPGGLIYTCMDWRHMTQLLAARQAAGCDIVNLCVWAKSNGGMGSLYRSRHELVFVLRNGDDRHTNNVQLGRFGRNRTNVWNYPGASRFAKKGKAGLLDLHPTVKPIALVADAIQDSTDRGDFVLDPFLGSGTTVLAAERTGRICCAIELDPIYVDTAIIRWQRMTGLEAKLADGCTFAELGTIRRGAR